jgi:hypothetical protein
VTLIAPNEPGRRSLCFSPKTTRSPAALEHQPVAISDVHEKPEGKLDVLRVECTKCDRKRRYHVHKFVAKGR